MSGAPTQTQTKYLRFIAEHQKVNGFTPTVRELALAMGVKSTNAVNDVLKALERKGLIKRSRMVARSIVLAPSGLTTACLKVGVRKAWSGAYEAFFTVDQQTFGLCGLERTKKSAEWDAKQLRIALERLRGGA